MEGGSLLPEPGSPEKHGKRSMRDVKFSARLGAYQY